MNALIEAVLFFKSGLSEAAGVEFFEEPGENAPWPNLKLKM
jgi:hypothetical protein